MKARWLVEGKKRIKPKPKPQSYDSDYRLAEWSVLFGFWGIG